MILKDIHVIKNRSVMRRLFDLITFVVAVVVVLEKK